MIWLFTAFSIWEAVMATFLSWPKMSVNWRRINSTSSSWTLRMISSLLYAMQDTPLVLSDKAQIKMGKGAPTNRFGTPLP